MADKAIIVTEIEDLLISASESDNKEQVKHGISRCNRALKALIRALKNNLKSNEKEHLILCIGKLKGFRVMFKELPVIIGRANRLRYPKVKWVDIKCDFNNGYLYLLTI